MCDRLKVVQQLTKQGQGFARASSLGILRLGRPTADKSLRISVPSRGSGTVAAVVGLISIMNADEKAIIDYLKEWPSSFVSGREIARKVGGKERYEEDRGWAMPILAQMVRIGLVEADNYGHYRLKQEEKKKRQKTHVSPQILKILKSSGKSFDTFNIENDVDEPPVPTYQPPTKLPAQNGKKDG